MKRLRVIKQSLAVVLAMLIALSSMSILAVNAVETESITTAEQSTEIKTEASVDDVQTEASSDIYKMWATTSYGLRFNSEYFPYKFKNQINGKTVTYPASWGAIEYEYAHNSKGNTAAWCIQPGVVINNADYGKITVDEDGNISNPAKAQTDYLKKLQKHPKLMNAMAKIIAYGKKNGATKSTSPYYYAVGLLLWDFVMGNRYTSGFYQVKSGKTSNIYKIYNTVESKRVLDVQEAAKDILEQIKKESDPVKTLKEKGDKKSTKLYKDISSAKKVRTNINHNVYLPVDPNKNGIYIGKSQAKFASLMKRNDISYTVVNHNGNVTDFTKKISVTLNKQGKLQVKTKENLYERYKKKGATYYIKITKTPKDYTKSNKSVLFESLNNARQSFVNTLPYQADKTVAYFPIYQSDIMIKGSLIINKKVISNIENNDINGLLEGWCFKIEYKVEGKSYSYLRTTDKEGAAPPIEDIPKGTVVTITELGKELPNQIMTNQWYNEQTYNGIKYAMPVGYKDKTAGSTNGNIRSAKVSINSSEQVDFEYVNEYEQKFELKIKKETSDGDDVSGYYFGIWDFQSSNKVITKPKLIGPTDKEGFASVYLDNINKTYLKNSSLFIIELGKLKDGSIPPSTTELEIDDNNMVPAFYDKNSDPAKRFEIPVKYRLVNDSFAYQKTSSAQAIPVTIYGREINEFYDNPEDFVKTFTVVNEADGIIKLKKKCSKTGKELEGAEYGIFEYHQNDGEDDYIGEYDEAGGDSYSESEIPDATEPTANDPATIDDEKSVDNQSDTITWENGRLQVGNGQDENGTTSLSGIYRRTGFIGTDTYEKISVDVKDASKKVQWNIFWYDSEKNYLGSVYKDNPPGLNDSQVVDIPEDVEYIRIGVHRATSLGGIDAVEEDFLLNKIITFSFVEPEEDTNIDISNIPVSENDEVKPLQILTSKSNEWVYSQPLPCGTYYIKEIKAPSEAYTVDDTKYTFTIEPGMNTQETALPIVREDKPSDVVFKKIDSQTVQGNAYENGTLISGAKICIYEKPDNGTIDYSKANPVYEFTSSNKQEEVIGKLKIGQTYIAHEKEAPKGYFLAEDIEFTVSTDGSIDKVNILDEPIELHISKVDITNSKELPGCTMKLGGRNGVIDEWVSTDTPHLIKREKLSEGETYTLTEVMSKDGYTKAESRNFKIEKGMPTKITMEDAPTKLRFSKVGTEESEGVTTSNELPGCEIEITDEQGKVIEKWTSTNEPHIIEGKLKINTWYYMKETSAAPGWKIAEPVKFYVENTGKIQDVQMVDEPQPVFKFSKQSLTGNKELPGCHIEVRDKDNNVIDKWISGNTPHIIENLELGKTYYMIETQPADGYTTAEKIEFTVPKKPQAQTITMKDAPTTVEFSKTSITNGKEIEGCVLEVKDTKGNVIEKWTSKKEPHIIKGKLKINTYYYLIETRPADGYATAEKIKFYVKDDGSVQHVKMKDCPIVLNIKKVAKHDQKLLLGGAKFKIIDTKTGKTVEKFTTKAGEVYKVKSPKAKIAGRKYKLVEIEAPKGYNKAKVKYYVVKDTNKAQTIKAVNAINIRFEIPQTGGLSDVINFVLVIILIISGIGVLTGCFVYFKRKKT